MTLTPDGTGLDGLLEAAMSACGTLPSPAETATIHRRLVAEIRLRLPGAERAMARVPVRSRAWYAHQRVIDATRDALLSGGVEPDPSASPLVAAMRVSELGRRLRDLSVYPAGSEDA
ncbi:DUF6415 family natural product biosynthesis protein [Streptomyces sp. NRRL B-1347]|uniref:DUF6415 family natural product biosynthesis protein n=1 Tax=Streptomyces sp. NRRL B-1347 TaxID=1476877 RepID=UPI00068E3A79|nr:DUF6415 family natural product biosynthesis protein [Streptomyces sp. NRRL B-1347]